MQLTAEDQEALGVVRGLLQLAGRLPLAAPPSDGSEPLDSSSAQLNSLARAASDLAPLIPELGPGVLFTAQLFVRALVKR